MLRRGGGVGRCLGVVVVVVGWWRRRRRGYRRGGLGLRGGRVGDLLDDLMALGLGVDLGLRL